MKALSIFSINPSTLRTFSKSSSQLSRSRSKRFRYIESSRPSSCLLPETSAISIGTRINKPIIVSPLTPPLLSECTWRCLFAMTKSNEYGSAAIDNRSCCDSAQTQPGGICQSWNCNTFGHGFVPTLGNASPTAVSFHHRRLSLRIGGVKLQHSAGF